MVCRLFCAFAAVVSLSTMPSTFAQFGVARDRKERDFGWTSIEALNELAKREPEAAFGVDDGLSGTDDLQNTEQGFTQVSEKKHAFIQGMKKLANLSPEQMKAVIQQSLIKLKNADFKEILSELENAGVMSPDLAKFSKANPEAFEMVWREEIAKLEDLVTNDEDALKEVVRTMTILH